MTALYYYKTKETNKTMDKLIPQQDKSRWIYFWAVFCIIFCTAFLYVSFMPGKKILLLGFLALVGCFLCALFPKKATAAFYLAVKYRYWLGAFVILLFTVFKLHGSSLNALDTFFADTDGPTSQILWGRARPVRSDEWGVQTMYYMSQDANDYALYNPFLYSGRGQNMHLGYNAPVFDILLIGKPATWGYLLFGAERGLAFYYSFKLVFLTLLSFELCMLITKENVPLSVLGGFWVAFSPAVQWWFSPHFVDVLFWAAALVVVAYHFFTAKGDGWRIFFAVLAVVAVCGFVLALFPSLQVPLGMVAVGLVIAFLWRDKATITFGKKHLVYVAGAGLVACLALGMGLYEGKDALTLMARSAYPGARVSLGGGGRFEDLFTNITSVFLPFSDLPYLNNSEVSSFFHFAPALVLLLPYFRKKKAPNLGVGYVLAGMLFVCFLWMFVVFPEPFAKITLFSYVNRISYVYGFLAVLFTVWAISVLAKNPGMLPAKIKWPVLAFFVVANLFFLSGEKMSYLPQNWRLFLYMAEIFVLAAVLFFILSGKMRFTALFMSVLIFVSGFTVNPLVVGNGALTNKTVINQAKIIAQKDPEAYFLVDDVAFVVSNAFAANGVKTIGATTFYPDLARWQDIDSDREYIEYYNRYANKVTTLTKDETSFMLIHPDYFCAKIQYGDLAKLGVKYVVSAEELEAVKDDAVYFTKIFDCPNDPDIYLVSER